MIYIDTSAVMKALVAEEGSDAVRELFAASEPLISSRLLAVELHAAAQRRDLVTDGISEILDSVSLISLDDDVLDSAIALQSGLRALDALHLATALLIGDELTSFVAFDHELNRVAAQQGLPVHM